MSWHEHPRRSGVRVYTIDTSTCPRCRAWASIHDSDPLDGREHVETVMKCNHCGILYTVEVQ